MTKLSALLLSLMICCNGCSNSHQRTGPSPIETPLPDSPLQSGSIEAQAVGAFTWMPSAPDASIKTESDEIGVAFDMGQVPADHTIRVKRKDGPIVRASVVLSNHWPDGSLRWVTLRVIDDSAPLGPQTYELMAEKGTQAPSSFDPWTWIASQESDLTITVSQQSGSLSGALPGGTYSLKAGAMQERQREILANTKDEVIARVSLSLLSDEHLRAEFELHFILDAAGQKPTALIAYPVLSQDWWSTKAADNVTILMKTKKERRTYDATVKWGEEILDARTQLVHAYHTRWASLDASADGHWINLGTPKTKVVRRYSEATLRQMMRAGYIQPQRLTGHYEPAAPLTYAPLRGNGHRTGDLSDGAGYAGRGLHSTHDVAVLVSPDPLTWNNAKIAAHANLSYWFHFSDPRPVDGAVHARLMPWVLNTAPYATYPELGAPIAAVTGQYSPYKFEWPDGKTGIGSMVDAAHMNNPAALMAALLGRQYLIDSVLSGWDFLHRAEHWDTFGHKRQIMYFGDKNSRGCPSVPATEYAQLISIRQERGLGWALMVVAQANALVPDNSIYKPLVEADTAHINAFLEDSLRCFPQAQKDKGAVWSSESQFFSLWMNNFIILGAYSADRITRGHGFNGFHELAEIASNRTIDTWRYAPGHLAAYRDVPVLDRKNSVYASPSEPLVLMEGAKTIGNRVYMKAGFQSGDFLYLSGTNSGGDWTPIPTGLSFTQKYFPVDIQLPIGDTQGSFRLATTPNGAPIEGIEDKASFVFGALRQHMNSFQHYGDDGQTHAADSYLPIASAGFEMALFNGHKRIDAALISKKKTYMETFAFKTLNTWDLDAAAAKAP